jgi:hypothetical protein
MPDILSPEQVRLIRLRTRRPQPNVIYPEGRVVVVEADHLTLCDTLEAQAEVIQRYKDGWQAGTHPGPWAGEWWGHYRADNPKREPMPESHQLVIYGEVVAKREDTDGT